MRWQAARMFRFYELIRGPGRVNKRPVPSESTCFVVRNGGASVCRESSILSRMVESAFRNRALSEGFCVFFFCPLKFFFRSCHPVSQPKRMTQGVPERFCVFLPPLFDVLKRLDFADPFLRIRFSRVAILYFSKFEILAKFCF